MSTILVCGARGFVGRAVTAALRARGHEVVEGVSPVARGTVGAAARTVDFTRDLEPAAWAPRLAGIDAVVNAIGVLRDTRARPIDAVHRRAPIALFDACAAAGVRRVVQVSALGIVGSGTAYARTKLAAEQRLDALTREGRLEGFVLRPSIVFGPGGASTELFLALSRLPLLPVPGPVQRARVQPVAVAELAEVVAAQVDAPPPAAGAAATLLEAVGPEPVALGAFIASLRTQAGRGRAAVIVLPDWLTQLSARAGDALPMVPWCTETLAMLGSDNVGDPAPFERALGRPATRYDRLLGR